MSLGDTTSLLDPVGNKNTFFSHVFSTTEEGKAEILNVIQYALLGVIPIVILNKTLQRFIPDADADKSSIELLAEVLIQIVVMFIGIVIIHRIITFIPTYSEFKYENLTLTNVILTFMVLILSIQTKLGIKVNILADRVAETWNGREALETKSKNTAQSNHTPSQGDYLGTSQDLFPPAPMSTGKVSSGYDTMMRGNPANTVQNTVPNYVESGPMAANTFGSPFGSSF
jgi:hypothetical protein